MAWARRVVTGLDANGRSVFRSDATPPKTVDRGEATAGASELLVFPGHPGQADDGGDSAEPGFPLHPPVGGATVRLIRIPPPPPGASGDERWLRVPTEQPDRPGMHTTDTLDFEVVLDGDIVLGLDDGEHELHAGDTVVQRGTAHRWRVTGDRPCTYLAVMIRPDPAAADPKVLRPRSGAEDSPGSLRRLVTGTDAGGRSCAEIDGPPAVRLGPTGPRGATLWDLWQTGGPLRAADQGGDAEGWELEPAGAGIAFRMVELGAGHDPGPAGWHTTDTIDVDLILSGSMELALPECDPVILEAGSAVIQRATNHRWRPVGDTPVRMASVMFGLR
jgi:quercetin dioxygenase-like cupin family protein